jgi:hypothetical protein
MVPTWRGARQLEARRSARSVSKGGGSRGAARGVVVGCLAPASRWCSGDDSYRPVRGCDASVAMRLASGPQARWQARGCDGQLTEAWTEHLGVGHGHNFTGGQRGEEHRMGMGLEL